MNEELKKLNRRFNLEWCAKHNCFECRFDAQTVCINPNAITDEDAEAMRAAISETKEREYAD